MNRYWTGWCAWCCALGLTVATGTHAEARSAAKRFVATPTTLSDAISNPFSRTPVDTSSRKAEGATADTSLKRETRRQGRFTRFVYRTISTSPSNREAEKIAAATDNAYFHRYAGRTIGTIRVERCNVFENSSSWGARCANSTHRVSQEKAIRRNIFLHQGDRFDPDLAINNRQLIRSLSYISKADIRVVPSPTDSMVVDLVFTTRDRWSIGADLKIKGNGDTYIELYDDNILGMGDKLGLKTYFNWRSFAYGGNMVEYEARNLFGSFINGRIVAGKGFNNADYGAELQKLFIKPRDYTMGAYGYYRRDPLELAPLDSLFVATHSTWGAWFGESFQISNAKSSIFVTAHYNSVRHHTRPDVSAESNPYFYNDNTMLFNTGVYRERFRSASLIYGYGVEEDIPYGYLFSLCGGPSWGEFGNRWYMGGSFSAGHFTSIGYLRWSLGLGSYMNNRDGRFYRTTLLSRLNWFSNLMGNGRTQVRQFVNMTFTRGWNRLDGYRESVTFNDDAPVRGLNEKVYGSNRLTVNSETVVFTPWNLYGFRFAVYGFADAGLLGYRGNLFANSFFSTLGIGVRIKNERLIFRTINIRLGIALGKTGWMAADYFNLGTEDKQQPIRYLPDKASVIDYNNELSIGNGWN